MSRRNEPQNPKVVNSAGEFTAVGYLTGGTPMPVNVIAGGVGGGVMQTQVQDSAGVWANAGYVAGGGTPVPVNIVAGVLTGANPSDGTVGVKSGTLNNLMGGTIHIAFGTVAISDGTINAVNPTMGTLNEVYKIGTLYAGSICVTSGTVGVSAGTVNLAGIGTVGISQGTLSNVYTLGTLYAGSVCVTSGTIGISAGTVNLSGAGTVGINQGTLNAVYQLGTLYAGSVCITSGTLGINAGTVIPAGLGTVRVDLGTIKISDGTLGTVNVYTKHDLHIYDNAGTFRIAGNATAGGTVVAGVANKCIKVHHYTLETDGTFLAFFQDGAVDRGTLGPMWTFIQREGISSVFIPYPGYFFKTSAGTPLFLGTASSLNNFACAGTLNVHVVYTDDDAS